MPVATQARAPAALPARLIPVTSFNISRHDNLGCAVLGPWPIDRGVDLSSHAQRSSPARIPSDVAISTSLASNWKRFMHPEGRPYFVSTGKFDFVVVTECDIEDVQVERQVQDCVKGVNKALQFCNLEAPSRCELFLELGMDGASCKYYFVDHTTKRLFWLEDLSTESLGIPVTVSLAHLGLVLERHYWVHVDYFPMHHDANQHTFSQLVEELRIIISHGQADRLTSRLSTFPYKADTCRQLLKLLSRKGRVDGCTLSQAASLASAILSHRFITLYGWRRAQSDILREVYPIEHKWLLTMASLLMWGIPKYYLTRLESLFMSRPIYVDQWTHFISTSLVEWQQSLLWGLWASMASIISASMYGATTTTSLSVVFCVASVVSAVYLRRKHLPLVGSSAAIGDRFLLSIRSSTLGFLPLSILFSLPKTCCLWGLGLVVVQSECILKFVTGELAALIAAFALVGMVMLALWVAHCQPAQMIAALFSRALELLHPPAADIMEPSHWSRDV